MRFPQTFIEDLKRHADIVRIVGLLIVSFVFADSSFAQEPSKEQWTHGLDIPSSTWSLPKAPATDLRTLVDRWKSIAEEEKTTNNRFAGTYWNASNHAVYLRWAPKSGYVYLQTYENLDVVDFSYGKVVETPQLLKFIVERDVSSSFFGKRLTAVNHHWIPAEWQHHKFLVAADRISDFGLYAAGLDKYNEFLGGCCEFSPFLLRLEKTIPAEDEIMSPWVPGDYVRFIRQPIQATISYVGRRRVVNGYSLKGPDYGEWLPRASLTTIGISAGSRQGVKAGLLFRIRDVPYGQYLKVTRVYRTRSSAVLIRQIDDDGRETYYDSDHHQKIYPKITTGQKVTTSPQLF